MTDHNPFASPPAVEFPAGRFARAGASADELTMLEEKFNDAPAREQIRLVEHLAGISDAMVADLVAETRGTGLEGPSAEQIEADRAADAKGDADAGTGLEGPSAEQIAKDREADKG